MTEPETYVIESLCVWRPVLLVHRPVTVLRTHSF